MPRFRKRPVEVDAVQLCWRNWSEVCDFLGSALMAENQPSGAEYATNAADIADTCGEPGPEYIRLKVRTINGKQVWVRHGDWIIAEAAAGRFYPCDPAVFAETYEGPLSTSSVASEPTVPASSSSSA